MLQDAPAIGSLVAFLVSGRIGRVRRQGVAIVGGGLCLAGLALASILQRRFLAYDARTPHP